MSDRRRRLRGDPPEDDPAAAQKEALEASGLPTSLYGRIDMKEMGSRASRETAPVKKTSVTKSQPAWTTQPPSKASSRVADEFVGLSYKPRTRETRQAFEFFSSLLHSLLGADVPHDAILTASDEVLEILKEGDLKDLDRKTNVEAVLGGPIDTEMFQQMMNLSRRITDYRPAQSEPAADASEEDGGVAVMFVEGDDEGDEDEVVHEALSDAEEEANLVPAFAMITENRPLPFDEEEAQFLQYPHNFM